MAPPKSSRGVSSRVLNSRRAVTACLAIICLTVMALAEGMDTSVSIAAIACAIAGAGAFQHTKKD